MKVKFIQKHKSITSFDESTIVDFSIFLGVNGAGKTHLLKALQEGFVAIDNISKEKVSYFNLQTFLIKNQRPVTPASLDEEKMQAWNILEAQKATFESYDNNIKPIVGEADNPYDIDVKEEQKEQYIKQKKAISDFINGQTEKKPKIRKLLKTGVFESRKYATTLTQAEFFKFSSYNPDDYELLESLSEVFLDYQKKIIKAKLRKSDGGEGLNENDLQKLEAQSPWNFVNKMFQEFGLVHTISKPEFEAGDLINSQALSFQVKLFINDEEIDFEDLSSGEKILCALAITVYQDNRSEFPKLLLLDEVDASLHPSMIQNLLDVIREVFIKNGCNVILATHSPTTVALAPEESLFEVQKGSQPQKIRKISQSDAINLLSEGIITFEKGLKLQRGIDETKKLQILTEGNNAEHIKQAIAILDNPLTSQIKIISDGGGQQLKNAFDAFQNADHSNKFLFVWDCDFFSTVEKITETANFKTFCFAENTSNTKARDKKGNAVGIENLYPDSLFTDDVYSEKELPGSYGTTTKVTEFDKQKFLTKIQADRNTSTFENFKPLITKIKELTAISEEE